MRTIILISFLYSLLICQYPNFTTPYIQTIADVIERYDNGTPKIVKYYQWEYDKLVLKQTLEFSSNGTLFSDDRNNNDIQNYNTFNYNNNTYESLAESLINTVNRLNTIFLNINNVYSARSNLFTIDLITSEMFNTLKLLDLKEQELSIEEQNSMETKYAPKMDSILNEFVENRDKLYNLAKEDPEFFKAIEDIQKTFLKWDSPN